MQAIQLLSLAGLLVFLFLVASKAHALRRLPRLAGAIRRGGGFALGGYATFAIVGVYEVWLRGNVEPLLGGPEENFAAIMWVAAPLTILSSVMFSAPSALIRPARPAFGIVQSACLGIVHAGVWHVAAFNLPFGSGAVLLIVGVLFAPAALGASLLLYARAQDVPVR